MNEKEGSILIVRINQRIEAKARKEAKQHLLKGNRTKGVLNRVCTVRLCPSPSATMNDDDAMNASIDHD